MPTQSLPAEKRQALPDAISTGSLQRHLNGWLLDGKIRQLSPGTLANRKLLLEKLLWFLQHEEHATCGKAELKAFFAYIGTGQESETGRWGNTANSKPVRPSTVQMYYGRLRTFFAYLVEEGVLDASPFASLKPPVVREDQIQPFTPAQISALLHAATTSACPKRNKAILLFLLDTGIRASELCSLRMCDVDLPGQKAVVLGKGNKKRVVYFGKNVQRARAAYLKEEEHADREPLFFAWDETTSRSAMTRSGLLQLIRRLGKVAKPGAPSIAFWRCPHCWRPSRCTSRTRLRRISTAPSEVTFRPLTRRTRKLVTSLLPVKDSERYLAHHRNT